MEAIYGNYISARVFIYLQRKAGCLYLKRPHIKGSYFTLILQVNRLWSSEPLSAETLWYSDFYSIFEPLLGVKCMLDSSRIFLSYLVMLVGQWFVIKCPSNSFLTFIVIKLQKDYKQCKMISGFVETLFYLKKLFVVVFFSCLENYFHALHHYWSLRDTKNCKYVPQTAAVWTKCSKEDKNKMWRMTGSVEYKLSALFTGYSDSAYR